MDGMAGRRRVEGGAVRNQFRLLLPMEEGWDRQLAQHVEGQRGDGLVRRGQQVGQLGQGVEHQLVVRIAKEAGEEAEDGPDGLGGRLRDRRHVCRRFRLRNGGGGRTAAAAPAAGEGRLWMFLTTNQKQRWVSIEEMVQGRVDGIQGLDPLVQVGLG